MIKIVILMLMIVFCMESYAVDIEGSQGYQRQVKRCLKLLSQKAPKEYKLVTDYIGVISQSKRSGMRAWENPPRYQMSDKTAFHSLTWCAGTIAHDSYHSYLYNKYLPVGGGKPPYDKWAGITAEKKAIKFQLTVMIKLGASKHEINYLKSLDGTHGDLNKDGRFSKEDYDKRYW
jgi:hypothetical protein